MCYYNGVKVSKDEHIRLKSLEKLISRYGILDLPLVEGPLYNKPYPVLKRTEGKEDFEIKGMEWGFLPDSNEWPFLKTRNDVNKFRFGFKDEQTGTYQKPYTTLNAMSENLFVNDRGRPSMFRHAVTSRRCLVLSTGFFEWRHIKQMGKRGKLLKETLKYPYHLFLPERKQKDEPFYMAGFWSNWTDLDTGEMVESFTLTTTEANSLCAMVHNTKKRMPTILDDSLAWEWMFGNLSAERITKIARSQFPSEFMEVYPVAKDFKTALDPTERFHHKELPPLGNDVADFFSPQGDLFLE